MLRRFSSNPPRRSFRSIGPPMENSLRISIYETRRRRTYGFFRSTPGAGGDRKPFAFLQTEFDEDVTQFSPDMRWISYASNESGNWELYVRPFIGADGQPAINQTRKWQVSTNGVDIMPLASNGIEMEKSSSIYRNDNKLMAADVKANGSTFDVGAVRPLFEVKAKGAVISMMSPLMGRSFSSEFKSADNRFRRSRS